jgi:Ras GTPase-activating-like protein IQGAP2/3
MSSSLRSDVPRRVSSAKDRAKFQRSNSKTGDMSVATMLQPASRGSTSTNSSFEPVSRTNTYSSHDGARSLRQSKRVSMTALYASMSAKDKDLEISDDLARAQRALRDLKSKISNQSKKNFVLEKDVRYLDSRIALLIQNRMALEEVCLGLPWKCVAC